MEAGEMDTKIWWEQEGLDLSGERVTAAADL